MDINLLITVKVLQAYISKGNKGLSKTKLLKLIYLVDYYYYRKYRSKMTNFHWIYFLFGPWTKEYEDLLNTRSDIFDIKQDSYNDKDFQLISLNQYLSKMEEDLDIDRKSIIQKVLNKFSNKELNEILDFVYYETEPMINAQERKEELDFSTIKNEEYYEVKSIKEMSKTQAKKIQDRVKLKLEKFAHL